MTKRATDDRSGLMARETKPGRSTRRPGGKGWSGPSGEAPSRDALRARGGSKRTLNSTPLVEAAYREAAARLGLDHDARGTLSRVWERALAALLAELGVAKGGG